MACACNRLEHGKIAAAARTHLVCRLLGVMSQLHEAQHCCSVGRLMWHLKQYQLAGPCAAGCCKRGASEAGCAQTRWQSWHLNALLRLAIDERPKPMQVAFQTS